MRNFALLGASGYIAPRHLRAIKETGNNLLVAMDINDSVGVMDSHFPNAEFFTEFEEFEAFVDDRLLAGKGMDYVSICSPNYLHAPHMKFALKKGLDVICEKPLVLTSSDLDVLQKYEQMYDSRVNSILQLRLHPSIIALKERVDAALPDKKFDVDLTYLTSRGKWYMKSWKGLDHKSGGVATNIGVHFFDMLYFVFGNPLKVEVHYRDAETVAGYLEYERARVKWFLSINGKFLPQEAVLDGRTTYRSVSIEGEDLEFSVGFTDLHTQSYQKILEGKGFGIEDNRAAIETVEIIRQMEVSQSALEAHPYLSRALR